MENPTSGDKPSGGKGQRRVLSPFVILLISLLAVGLVIALVAWWYMRIAAKPLPASEPQTTIIQEYDERISNAPKETTFDLVFDGAKLVKGTHTIRVAKGSNVHVNITSVGEEEIKATLQGYNIITEANSDAPGGFSFIADHEGEFAFYVLDEEHEEEAEPAESGTGQAELGEPAGKIIVR